MNWEAHAGRLAGEVAHRASRWHGPVAMTPRHLFVPNWWERRRVRRGVADSEAWVAAAYSDRTLVTRIGVSHADHAMPDDRPQGWPTSSATLPSLVL